VLAQLDTEFSYGDCDYGLRKYGLFRHDKGRNDTAALRAWLVARFTEGDQLEVVSEEIATPYGTPPNDPRVAGIELLRKNLALRKLGREPLSLGAKVLLNAAGSRIGAVALASYELCVIFPATPTPSAHR
jgi:hypothetical protein